MIQLFGYAIRSNYALGKGFFGDVVDLRKWKSIAPKLGTLLTWSIFHCLYTCNLHTSLSWLFLFEKFIVITDMSVVIESLNWSQA